MNIIENSKKENNTENTKKSNDSKSSHSVIKKEISYIHTIRQLYSICKENDNDDMINGIMIKDIFAGRKTSFYCNKYLSGIKLVECSYYSYDKKENIIRFRFPYENNNFIISTHFNDSELFKKINNQLYNYNRPILIYAEWHNDQAEIISKKQIVPLK